MANNFAEIMSQNSTEELLSIVNEQRNKYQPAAIEAAEVELTNRNIFQDPKIVSLKKQLMALDLQRAAALKKISNQKRLMWGGLIVMTIAVVIFLNGLSNQFNGFPRFGGGIVMIASILMIMGNINKKVPINALKKFNAEIEETKSKLSILENH